MSVASLSLSLAEGAVRLLRRGAARAELRLHAWRVGMDPEARRWVAEQRAAHDRATLDREGIRAHFAGLRDADG